MEGLFKFLNEDLEKIDGIAGTQTWNVLRTEKFFYNWEGEDVGPRVGSRRGRTVTPYGDEASWLPLSAGTALGGRPSRTTPPPAP